jgi:uncharacterized protein YndB with AHSA1/START domain
MSKERAMPAEHAVLIERDGRSVLRFERLLTQPRERVWRALTERGELAAWHPTPFVLDARAGGAVEYLSSPGVPEMAAGRVLEIAEPSLLVVTWGPPPGDELRWALEERGRHCLLTLEHSFHDRFKAARDGAGWHICLLALEALLDGEDVPERGSPERLPDGWSELNEDYQRRFGISPEQATPVPGM